MTSLPTERVIFASGCALAGLAVGLGAFAAHGLKQVLEPAMLAVFETGVRYQLAHGLALLAVAWAHTRWPNRWVRCSAWLLAGGTLLFSGSLYALSLSGWRSLGAITPLGGIGFLAGWLALGLGALLHPR